jgi:hypothetical protein
LIARRPPAATLGTLAVGGAAAAASTYAAMRAERALAPRVPLWAWAAYRTVLASAILVVWHDRAR